MKFQETGMFKSRWNYEKIYVEIKIHPKGFCVIDNDLWYKINVYYLQPRQSYILIKYT